MKGLSVQLCGELYEKEGIMASPWIDVSVTLRNGFEYTDKALSAAVAFRGSASGEKQPWSCKVGGGGANLPNH